MVRTPQGQGDGLSAAAAAEERAHALFSEPFGFVLSAPSLETLPPADRPEVAFAGRSNVGKSSLLNALVSRRGLARASNTPGRTQALNFFAPATTRLYLVDLPGYGYAEAPKDLVKTWQGVLKSYLAGRPSLRRVLLLIDARHGIKAVDREMIGLLNTAAQPYSAVLTKADKIPARALSAVVAATEAALAREPAAVAGVLATSSETGLGLDAVRALIAEVTR